MLCPFYMLTGHMDVVSELTLANGAVEKTYEDETGRRAVVVTTPRDAFGVTCFEFGWAK
jgi:hypothetical protein